MRVSHACILISGILLSIPSVWAVPTLSGGIIDDLQGLGASLDKGKHAAVERQATRQAERLAGGNASDRWARALYLQLTANAEVHQGKDREAADHLATARHIRGVEQARADRWLRQEAGLRARLGEHARASDLLGNWLQRHSADAQAQWLMAQLKAEADDWNGAADWAQKALGNTREPSRQRLTLAATALQKAGRQQDALAVLERQLASAEGDPDAWRRAAGLAQRMGDPGRAASLWETAWRRGILGGQDDLLQRIKLHLAAGTPARAAEILEQALSQGSLADSVAHRRLLARAWQSAKDQQHALAAWRDVAERSELADDWLQLGQLAAEWGHLDVARDALELAEEGGAAQASDWLASLPKSGEAAGTGSATEAEGF